MSECFLDHGINGGGEALRIAYVNRERRCAGLLLGQGWY